VNTDHVLPPLRDFPPGQLANRSQHLATEIGRQCHRTSARRRSVRILVAALAATAIVVAPALALSRSMREFVGLTTNASSPPIARGWVKATLIGPVDLAARPGTKIRIAWRFGHRFGGGGIFVRLVSASGAPAEVATAHGTPGRYAAVVRVPQGGIGAIQIGIEGTTSGANGTHPAPVLFPITNDPLG
jgi:hypothetical protein